MLGLHGSLPVSHTLTQPFTYYPAVRIRCTHFYYSAVPQYRPRTLLYIDIKPDLMIMEPIMNLMNLMSLMNLRRVLRGSWVRVGEGCVDWIG